MIPLIMLGMPEILVIVFALLLLFGGKKIPQLMRGLGEGIRDFRKATKEIEDTKEGIEDTGKIVRKLVK